MCRRTLHITEITDHRKEEQLTVLKVRNPEEINQAASVACVLEDEETDEAVAIKDADTLPLYNLKQKETVNDVIINPAMSTEQQTQIRYDLCLIIQRKRVCICDCYCFICFFIFKHTSN